MPSTLGTATVVAADLVDVEDAVVIVVLLL
jgi:hypothetical protein